MCRIVLVASWIIPELVPNERRKRYIFHSPPKGSGRLSRAFSATLTGRFGVGTGVDGAEGRW
jgi:hypothetical protein